MLALAELVNLCDFGLAGLAAHAAGRVRAGVVRAAREVHHVAHLEAARGGRPCAAACGAAGAGGLAAVLGYAVAPDILPVDGDRATLHAVGVVALNDRDGFAAHLFHDANVVSAACAVAGAVVVPVVENVVAGGGHISVVLLPAPEVLKELDMLLAPALRRDNVGQPCGDGDRAGERATPCVRVLHRVPSGEGLVAVVEVDDFLVASVSLVTPEVALRDADYLLSQFLFRHTGSSISGRAGRGRVLLVVVLAVACPLVLYCCALVCRTLKVKEYAVAGRLHVAGRLEGVQHPLVPLCQLLEQEVELHLQVPDGLACGLRKGEQPLFPAPKSPLCKAVPRAVVDKVAVAPVVYGGGVRRVGVAQLLLIAVL